MKAKLGDRKNQIPIFKPNIVLRGSILPEPIKVIATVPMGDSLKLIGEGLNSGKVHQPVLTQEQLAQLEVAPD